MNIILNYFVEANLGLILFYALYKILFTEETSFSFNRTYLLGSIFFSLLFPLLNIGSGSVVPSMSTVIPPHYLPEIVVTAEGEKAAIISNAEQGLSFWTLVMWIYVAGFTFLLIRFVFQVGRLLARIQSYSFKNIHGNGKIIETNTPHPTFSFFNYIFIGNLNELSEEEKQQIICHEMVHAKKMHSVDILLVEILRIVFWFNPLIKNYKHSIIMVHEFQADADTVMDGDSKEYCNLLARVALLSADFKLANQFTNSLTLKRIKMLNAMKKKMSIWKLAVLVPVVAGFFFVVACQDQVVSEMSEVAKNSTMAVEYPQEVQKELDRLKENNPNGNFIVIDMNEEGKEALAKLDEKYNVSSIQSMSVIKVEEIEGAKKSYVILDYDENAKRVADHSSGGEEVFTIVEETAMYPGGIEAFGQFVYDNIKYPVQAKQKGIEGKVHVQIIIEKDGSVSNIMVMKGIGAGCDEEALRVMALSKPWNPAKQRGKAVRQKMIVPILFKLTDGSVETGKVEPLNKKFMVETVHESKNGGTIIKGIIKDEDGNPLPGTNIVLEGTTLGTVSDLDGSFTLKTKQSSGKIQLSFVGYQSQQVTF